MKSFKFWVPTIVGVLLTPFFLVASLISAGVGHGSYVAAEILYPIPLLLLFLQPVDIDDARSKEIIENAIFALTFVTAILQFPLYGFIISYAEKRVGSRFWRTLSVCALFHTAVSLLVMTYTLLARK